MRGVEERAGGERSLEGQVGSGTRGGQSKWGWDGRGVSGYCDSIQWDPTGVVGGEVKMIVRWERGSSKRSVWPFGGHSVSSRGEGGDE